MDLGKPVKVGRVVIEQAFPELKRVKKFAIEYRDGDCSREPARGSGSHQSLPDAASRLAATNDRKESGEWKPCYRGENLGATLDETFEPVTAQHFRLNITESTDGPTVCEFRLYGERR